MWKAKTAVHSTSDFVAKTSDIRNFSQNIRSDDKTSEGASTRSV